MKKFRKIELFFYKTGKVLKKEKVYKFGWADEIEPKLVLLPILLDHVWKYSDQAKLDPNLGHPNLSDLHKLKYHITGGVVLPKVLTPQLREREN